MAHYQLGSPVIPKKPPKSPSPRINIDEIKAGCILKLPGRIGLSIPCTQRSILCKPQCHPYCHLDDRGSNHPVVVIDTKNLGSHMEITFMGTTSNPIPRDPRSLYSPIGHTFPNREGKPSSTFVPDHRSRYWLCADNLRKDKGYHRMKKFTYIRLFHTYCIRVTKEEPLFACFHTGTHADSYMLDEFSLDRLKSRLDLAPGMANSDGTSTSRPSTPGSTGSPRSTSANDDVSLNLSGLSDNGEASSNGYHAPGGGGMNGGLSGQYNAIATLQRRSTAGNLFRRASNKIRGKLPI